MTDTHVSPDAVIAAALRPEGAPDPDDLVHEVDGVFERPEDVPWEIGGRREAEWALAKVRAAHEEYADATAPAREAIDILQARVDELREYIDAEGKARDHTVGFFTGHLTAWLRRLRRKDLDDGIAPDKATKSIKLAGGTVTSRARPGRLEVQAPTRVAEWAAEHASGVARFEPKVSLSKLREHIVQTGEVPPGVTYQPATEDDRTYRVDIK